MLDDPPAKPEGKPGQAWHQDELFVPHQGPVLTAAWIALDDATVENGCLCVLPGSHRRGVLRGRGVRLPYRDEDAVAVEVSAGSVAVRPDGQGGCARWSAPFAGL